MKERFARPWLVPLRRAAAIVVHALALGALAAAGCDGGEQSCTEIGCSNQTTVTYDQTVGGTAYVLELRGEAETVSFSCNGPDAAENPETVICDGKGFVLDGHPFADRRSFFVTVTPEDAEDPVIDGIEVTLGVVETLQPNGESCEPTCYVRSGRVIQ